MKQEGWRIKERGFLCLASSLPFYLTPFLCPTYLSARLVSQSSRKLVDLCSETAWVASCVAPYPHMQLVSQANWKMAKNSTSGTCSNSPTMCKEDGLVMLFFSGWLVKLDGKRNNARGIHWSLPFNCSTEMLGRQDHSRALSLRQIRI